MANYICTVRTNYFKVKDEDRFKELLKKISAEGDIELFENKTPDGTALFGFGCYGSIYGILGDNNDGDYDELMEELQKLVIEDDAIIILEIGHENLRYVTGFATIVTADKVQTVDLSSIALGKVRDMLGDKNWFTRMDY